MSSSQSDICVVIGASHAGVNFAFALRREGWLGEIILYDTDPNLPYHRPPLSKAYLASDDSIDQHFLRSAESYTKENISLRLGQSVARIDRAHKEIVLDNGDRQSYHKLVIATGARPLVPKIQGIASVLNLFYMRTAADAENIRAALSASSQKRVAIIGGGYIGLETAASVKKLGAAVSLFECESRLLARVTAPEVSDFFRALHTQNGVNVLTDKEVVSIQSDAHGNEVHCKDGSQYKVDIIIVGVGISLNTDLALDAQLAVQNGIKVNTKAQSSDPDIYAIGDCTYHYNAHYERFLRLESVQNAVDQGKIAAQNILGKEAEYDALPWFWSDQYDVKLRMVGLSEGYDQVLVRKELGEGARFSVWYFKGDRLLAVDAINFAKAYVLGTRFIKAGTKVNKDKLLDPEVAFKPNELILA